MNNKKYFAVSDLHGLHWHTLLIDLERNGFELENKNHILVIAGDIQDGVGQESSLISKLMELDSVRRLIAVRGNHDGWMDSDDGYPTKRCPNMRLNYTSTTPEQQRWLNSLPFQVETEHFYLAHGIYVKDNIYESDLDKEFVSLWGCPAFLNRNVNDWWYVEHLVPRIKHVYSNSIEEYANSFDKPVILGHIGKPTLEQRVPEITFGENFNTYKDKIYWLDGGYLRTEKVFVKVFEF